MEAQWAVRSTSTHRQHPQNRRAIQPSSDSFCQQDHLNRSGLLARDFEARYIEIKCYLSRGKLSAVLSPLSRFRSALVNWKPPSSEWKMGWLQSGIASCSRTLTT